MCSLTFLFGEIRQIKFCRKFYNHLIDHFITQGGNIYVNMAINVTIEIPSYLFCLLTLDKLGRSPTLIATQLFSGLACLATLIIPVLWGHWPKVVLATVGKFATSAAFAIVFLQVSRISCI